MFIDYYSYLNLSSGAYVVFCVGVSLGLDYRDPNLVDSGPQESSMQLELSLPAVQTESCSYLHPGCSYRRQGPSAVNSCQEITQNKT